MNLIYFKKKLLKEKGRIKHQIFRVYLLIKEK